MIKLGENDIRLGLNFKDKFEAIAYAGNLLYENGYINREYIDSLFKREKQANTYLGNGVAIPHGSLEDKNNIIKTGVVILQVKEGVKWDLDNVAYLIVAIAAKSDDHMDILANLTKIIQDNEKLDILRHTNNKDEVINLLAEKVDKEDNLTSLDESDFQIVEELVVKNEHGLHARPASKILEEISNYDAEIFISFDNKVAVAKSLISLLSLGIEKGDKIRIYIRGADSEKAYNCIKKCLEETTIEANEYIDNLEYNILIDDTYNYKSDNIFLGKGYNKDIVVAPIYVLSDDKEATYNTSGDISEEWNRLKNALVKARKELIAIREKIARETDKEMSRVINTQISFLEDKNIIKDLYKNLNEEKNAINVWNNVVSQFINELDASKSKYIAERKKDLEDLRKRVLRLISGDRTDNKFAIDEPYIAALEELFPSDIANFNENILGVVLVKGSENSHASLLLNSMEIPYLFGCGDEVLGCENGSLAILDTFKGCLVVNPVNEDIELAKKLKMDLDQLKEEERMKAFEPAITKDKKRIDVFANISNEFDVVKAIDKGAEGVGLFRTEFLFVDRDRPPTIDEQYKVYSNIAERLKGLPFIIRLLDIGGDKNVRYLKSEKEENPFLGVRGIRLLLKNRDILKNQIMAIAKTAVNYNVNILIPMVTFYDEIDEVIDIVNEAENTYDIGHIKLGIMVEVPATAIMLDILAKKVDFFSIGTNDLTQYALAVDRTNSELARRNDHLHPSILRLIDRVVSVSKEYKKELSVCGEIASDMTALPFVIGLGIDKLSANINAISGIKYKINTLNYQDCADLAKLALKCRSGSEVRDLLKKIS
ncbi:MAG: phosphoenolpyruvate--protein phosphotransferase [Deferribacterota bacterium]|nr:phosphoenolpyruvate--protein phosphotransferase [Deferribacterota bacterium]